MSVGLKNIINEDIIKNDMHYWNNEILDIEKKAYDNNPSKIKKKFYNYTYVDMQEMANQLDQLPKLLHAVSKLRGVHERKDYIFKNELHKANIRANRMHLKMTKLENLISELKNQRYYLSEGFMLERKRTKRWGKKQECSICMNTINAKNDEDEQKGSIENLEWTTLGCDHDFHAVCINKWLIKKKTCPNCRKTVSDDLLDLYDISVSYLS